MNFEVIKTNMLKQLMKLINCVVGKEDTIRVYNLNAKSHYSQKSHKSQFRQIPVQTNHGSDKSYKSQVDICN